MCGLLEASLCVACWRLACLWLAGDLLVCGLLEACLSVACWRLA